MSFSVLSLASFVGARYVVEQKGLASGGKSYGTCLILMSSPTLICIFEVCKCLIIVCSCAVTKL